MFKIFGKKTNNEPGMFSRLYYGLAKTRNNLQTQVHSLFAGNTVDQKLLDELEIILLGADLGYDLTATIINTVKTTVGTNSNDIYSIVQQLLVDSILPVQQPLILGNNRPTIMLMVGVNGAGKTTTIGKLVHKFQQQNYQCLIAAGDTFRAAAIEQVAAWGQANNTDVITQQQGADSASVIHDAIIAATARNKDIVFADTAGRLPTQDHLMDELAKVVKVIKKLDASAPHQVLMVLDATIGQNALRQVEVFHQVVGVSGLIITKLDGTAKGGIVAQIAQKTKIPIYYIGVGESLEDLLEFNAKDFAKSLLS